MSTCGKINLQEINELTLKSKFDLLKRTTQVPIFMAILLWNKYVRLRSGLSVYWCHEGKKINWSIQLVSIWIDISLELYKQQNLENDENIDKPVQISRSKIQK